jgi:hypothetical protein
MGNDVDGFGCGGYVDGIGTLYEGDVHRPTL